MLAVGEEAAVGEGGGMSMAASSSLSSSIVAGIHKVFKTHWFLLSLYHKREIDLLSMASEDLQCECQSHYRGLSQSAERQ